MNIIHTINKKKKEAKKKKNQDDDDFMPWVTFLNDLTEDDGKKWQNHVTTFFTF